MIKPPSIKPQDTYHMKYKEMKQLNNNQHVVKSQKDGKFYIAQKYQVQPSQMHIIENKLKVIKRINHPNLVKYKEHYKEGNSIIQITEYCGGILNQLLLTKEQTLKKQLMCKMSPNMIIQYLIQMLFALDHLESVQIKPDLNFNSIYLNDSVLRISFDMNSNEWKNEVIKVAELFKYQKMQSHELEQIQKLLLANPPPTVKQMLNHPYLLKGMWDLYKMEKQPQKKLQPKKRHYSADKKKLDQIEQRAQNVVKEFQQKAKQGLEEVKKQQLQKKPSQRQKSVPSLRLVEKQKEEQKEEPKIEHNNDDFNMVKKQGELKELMSLYKSQLSMKKQYLNLSEIEEASLECSLAE